MSAIVCRMQNERITVRIDRSTLEKARRVAAQARRTLADWTRGAIQDKLAVKAANRRGRK